MILKYPYPYKAWFTVANDPDNTLIKDWKELDAFIWGELELPLSNSIFIKSFNNNLPQQVNLTEHPEILTQKHDIIHTWGDYMHSRRLGFDREDAIEAVKIIEQNSLEPKVWIDHAQFIGNLIHFSNKGSTPSTKDASGIVYKNYVYTLDLIKQIGIRYIWNGGITNIIGQDRKISASKYFMQSPVSSRKSLVKLILNQLIHSKRIRKLFKLNIPDNRQYYPNEFADGSRLYCFSRYGTWKDADIYGLGNILEQKKIDSLVENEGTMVAYTHLGKRPASKMKEPFHIPPKTKRSLRYIKEKYESKILMVSSISSMLDYLVLRDHVKFSPQKNTIEILPDNIRYSNITQSDLTNKKFSFERNNQFNLETIKIISGDTPLKFDLKIEEANIFSIIFK